MIAPSRNPHLTPAEPGSRPAIPRAPIPRPLHAPIAAVLLSLVAPVAIAQDSEPFRASSLLDSDEAPKPPRSPQNAAWVYYKAWDTITTQDERVKFTELTGNRPDSGKPLTKDQREILEKHHAYLEGLLEATAMETCDWGSRTDQGLGALLPHLGFTRQSARVLALDARRCAQDGNSTAAAERLVAMLRLSTHASTDHYLISTLVATAIGSFAMAVTDEIIRADQLTAPAARLILAAIRRVDTPDLYSTGESIELERRVTLDWYRNECRGPDANLKFIRALSLSNSLRGESHSINDSIALYIRQFSEQRVQSEVDRADRYFDAVARAWKDSNAAVALDELELEAAEFQWGFVTQATSAPFSNVRRSTDRMHDAYQRMSVRLRAILEASNTPNTPPAK